MNFNEEEDVKKLFLNTEIQFEDAFTERVLLELPSKENRYLRNLSFLGGLLLLGISLSYSEHIAFQVFLSAEWSVQACDQSITQFKSIVMEWNSFLNTTFKM